MAQAQLADEAEEKTRRNVQCARWLRRIRRELPWRVHAFALSRTHLAFDAESHCNLR